jgi:Fe2+ transport system protein FeoA
MTLDFINKGQKFHIIEIKDEDIRIQAIRLGIVEGTSLVCAEKIPGGPIIIRGRTQEIAVGRELAKEIEIKLS